MSETTTFPHQDLISEHGLTVAELPEKTQKKIGKFAAITDEDAKEAMDETIYAEIDEYLDKKKADAKKAETKEKIAAHKTKKMDVSKAATAKTPEQVEAEKKAAATANPPSRGLMKTIFGQS